MLQPPGYISTDKGIVQRARVGAGIAQERAVVVVAIPIEANAFIEAPALKGVKEIQTELLIGGYSGICRTSRPQRRSPPSRGTAKTSFLEPRKHEEGLIGPRGANDA